jgi:hypothetical protein
MPNALMLLNLLNCMSDSTINFRGKLRYVLLYRNSKAIMASSSTLTSSFSTPCLICSFEEIVSNVAKK